MAAICIVIGVQKLAGEFIFTAQKSTTNAA
jgi:hypothetical protein